jgi:hypothetical protein
MSEDEPSLGLQAPLNYGIGSLSSDYPPLFNFTTYDAVDVDDQFEMYVVYFTGVDPSSPIFQRAIGFPTSDANNQVAYIPWSWRGSAFFDPLQQTIGDCSQHDFKYCLQSRTLTGLRPAASRGSMRTYSGNVENLRYQQCPGGPPLSTNMIDTSRFFVWQHYKDFLNRDPLDPNRLDIDGLDYWNGEITQCGFDFTCVDRKRIDVSRAFFYSSEFIQQVPALADSNRCTDSYNREFVRQCYYRYLRRPHDPETDDPSGFSYWVSKLNSQCPSMGDGAYNEMIKAFLLSIEYRNRFPAAPTSPFF